MAAGWSLMRRTRLVALTADEAGCSLPLVRHHSLCLVLHDRNVIHEGTFTVVRMATYHVHARDKLPVVLLQEILVAVKLEAVVVALAIVQVMQRHFHALKFITILGPQQL